MPFSSVALLVDGDNLSARFAGKLIREASELGPLVIRRIYCNDVSFTAWSEAHSFRIIRSGAGKNASDILLSIEAMDFAHVRTIQAFAIASSDGDFSHIAHRLREMGRHVHGFGEKKAPKSFRLACETFVELPEKLASLNRKLSMIDKAVHEVLEEKDPNGGGLLVSQLNGLVRRKNASIKISERKEKNWPKYLSDRPDMYRVTGQGASRTVRIATSPSES